MGKISNNYLLTQLTFEILPLRRTNGQTLVGNGMEKKKAALARDETLCLAAYGDSYWEINLNRSYDRMDTSIDLIYEITYRFI